METDSSSAESVRTESKRDVRPKHLAGFDRASRNRRGRFDRRLARIITGNAWPIQRQFGVFPRFFQDFLGFGAFFRHFSGFSRPSRPRGALKRAF
jgi:hypothetical protein